MSRSVWAGVGRRGLVKHGPPLFPPLGSAPNPQDLPRLTLSIKLTFPNSLLAAAPTQHFLLPSFSHHALLPTEPVPATGNRTINKAHE